MSNIKLHIQESQSLNHKISKEKQKLLPEHIYKLQKVKENPQRTQRGGESLQRNKKL